MTKDAAHAPTTDRTVAQSTARALIGSWAIAIVLLSPADARASFLSPELEDKLATFIALFVLFVIPIVLIVLFWMVHVLPEKIAHKRHHPQFEAIRTLCLLSLVFGGLLWPFAWIWAYSKPVFYRMAYGTDRHGDAHSDEVYAREDDAASLDLRARLARLETRGIPESELRVLRADIEALESKFASEEVR